MQYFDEYTGVEAQNDTEFMSEGMCEDELTDEELRAFNESNKYY